MYPRSPPVSTRVPAPTSGCPAVAIPVAIGLPQISLAFFSAAYEEAAIDSLTTESFSYVRRPAHFRLAASMKSGSCTHDDRDTNEVGNGHPDKCIPPNSFEFGACVFRSFLYRFCFLIGFNFPHFLASSPEEQVSTPAEDCDDHRKAVTGQRKGRPHKPV